MTTTLAGTPGISRFTTAQLLRTARLFASDPELGSLLDTGAGHRQRRLLDASDHLQIWLLAWPPGSDTGWHDHDGVAGAFHVVDGLLAEHTWDGGRVHERLLGPDEGRGYGTAHLHHVANVGDEPALSLHLVTPALSRMTRYALRGGAMTPVGVERAGVDW
ncbi:MAG TPA: cysteine dioxygenase family protein [Pedococcus sp.]|jgi:hypothetical protein